MQSDDEAEIIESTLLDSDSILVGAYCGKIELDELRRYVAIDLVTALQPLTKDSLKTAREIEAFLMGETEKKPRLKAVEI